MHRGLPVKAPLDRLSCQELTLNQGPHHVQARPVPVVAADGPSLLLHLSKEEFLGHHDVAAGCDSAAQLLLRPAGQPGSTTFPGTETPEEHDDKTSGLRHDEDQK